MKDGIKPTTSEANGQLWGASAIDWAEIQEHTCAAVYHAVFDRLNVGEVTKYLDVGCGSGLAASLAAQRGAQVSGVDAADTLIAIAKSRSPSGCFRVSDIEHLPFEDGCFSLVTGFNSFQYAGNPTIALKEAKRVASSGASVVVMTWGEPEGMEAAKLVASLKPLLPPPPAGAPGPFALSDAKVLKEFVSVAGLTPVDVFDVESPWIYPDVDTALRGLRSSGVAAKAMQNTSLEAVNRAHRAALEPFIQDDGRLQIGATFRCVVALA